MHFFIIFSYYLVNYWNDLTKRYDLSENIALNHNESHYINVLELKIKN